MRALCVAAQAKGGAAMESCASWRRIALVTWFVLSALIVLVALPQATALAALAPDSPEVRALIDKGVAVIEKQKTERVGEAALYALTLLKADVKRDHPVIQDAMRRVREHSTKLTEQHEYVVYETGLCLLFLAEMDPTGNRAEIQAYLNHLLKIQKPEGGWGYPGRLNGDTSMTQYGVLAMWELSRIGVPTPVDAWERVTNWLLRTQDVSGAWGYQGGDDGTYKLSAQQGVRHSMASAGLGSLYICMDHFGGVRRGGVAETSTLPEGLQQVKKNDGRQFASTNKINFARAAEAMKLGESWMNSNYNMEPEEYTYYFLYAYERYQSFRELDTGQPFSHPSWYDDGIAMLTKRQLPTGGWQRHLPLGNDTAFAVLFMLRSSKKSIQKIKHLGAGTMVTVTGIPLEGNELVINNGKVATKPLAGPAEKLLGDIEDPNSPDYLKALESFDAKIAAASPKDLDKMADRLRALAGNDSPDARATALRSLGRTRDLENVPLLIAGLNDPDAEVFSAAEEGLRFMSRTFTERGEDEAPLTRDRRRAAQARWRNWYLSIRPNAKLEP